MTENLNKTKNEEWEIDNLPNRITLFRMLLIPVIIGSLFVNTLENEWIYNQHSLFGYIAAWTFVVAALTDFFDGYVARRKNIVTVFGSFLDPIADKFLVISSIIMLLALGRIPVLIVIILVLREMYVTALRLLASERNLTLPVERWGKWKTATQMVGIPMLMAYDNIKIFPMPLIGTIFIYIASFFSIVSALQYSIRLVKKVKQNNKKT